MNWLELLQRHCAKRGDQTAVAKQLGFAGSVVSRCLAGKYDGDVEKVAARVIEVYGKSEIAKAMLAEPAWLRALREEVKRTNGTRTANRLGMSEATVSQVLSGSYKANTLRIERRVRGVLLGEEVDCPVLFGDLPMHVCQDIQERPASRGFSSPMHQQAWYCCRGEGRFEERGPCPYFNCGGRPAQAVVTSPAAPTHDQE